MADWKDRSEINNDVVFFNYVSMDKEKTVDEVYVWDLDKTYLDTKIDSISGLMTTILERALNKKNIPGTRAMLQSLATYGREVKNQKFFPIYFITASPPQMEERILEKFQIDQIFPMGCFYKDNLANLRPGRLGRLTKQVGYKLQALLQLRARLPKTIRQVCWGDDSETDAVIYNLYSDICARRIGHHEIRMILEKLFVTGEQVDTILELQSAIPEFDPVEKIYINLATDTDPDYYLKFGRRTLATYNTFQSAVDLFQDGRLDLTGVLTVAQDMIYHYKYTPEELAKGIDELIRRGVLLEDSFYLIRDFLAKADIIHSSFTPSVKPLKEYNVGQEPWIPTYIDYLHDYR